MQNNYSQEWFCARAFSSLKKIDTDAWDYSDSLLLYIPGAEEEYETIQQTDTPYYQLVTKPEREYLQSIADDLVRELPNQFSYIDLGPGTQHKEQFIFDAARRQNKRFTYVPVDISLHFLQLAQRYAEHQVVPTMPFLCAFEELPGKLPSTVSSRFVSLGLTFGNYDPQIILSLLHAIAGEDGLSFVDVQVRDRTDMQAVCAMYKLDASRRTFDPKIALLGINVDRDVADRTSDDGINFWYILKNVTPKLSALGMKPGDKLLVLRSTRYTKKLLEIELRRVFASATFFDTNRSFLGALLKG